MTMIKRVVFDTNVVISGRLWAGAPGRALRYADSGQVRSYTTEPIVEELRDVLSRAKFAKRLIQIGLTAEKVIEQHLRSTLVIEPAELVRVVQADSDDDQVIACAAACRADYLISGDDHLLSLKVHQTTVILDVPAFLALLEVQSASDVNPNSE